MKLGRIQLGSPDGPVARLVRVEPEAGRVIDLRRAAAHAFAGEGATTEAAQRLAGALFPGSMRDAIGPGDRFLAAAAGVAAASADAASLPIDDVEWLPASDPSIVRDGLTFIDHIKGFHAKMGSTPPPSMLSIPGYFKG